MVLTSLAQVAALRQSIFANTSASLARLRQQADTQDALAFFTSLKFEPIGMDPISGKDLNFIEQLNQTFSDLVVLAAAQDLMARFPEKSFDVQLGATPGYDIHSTDGTVVAECFSATKVSSNNKLNKDCKKLLAADAPEKYLYFYSHTDSTGSIQNRQARYPDLHFVRIPSFDL